MLILSQAPADLKAVVEFLRAKNGPKIRRGVLNGKRVDYFKGQPGPPFPFHLYQNITCPDADGGGTQGKRQSGLFSDQPIRSSRKSRP